MLKPMTPRRRPAPGQRGFTLIEGLVSILIFSIGVLALVGLQSTAIRQTSQAQYRSEASMLANELIGQMWVADATLLGINFGAGGTAYNAWLPRVTAALPGAAANPPTVVVDGAGVVTLSIFWQAPNEPAADPPHQYTTVAQVRR